MTNDCSFASDAVQRTASATRERPAAALPFAALPLDTLPLATKDTLRTIRFAMRRGRSLIGRPLLPLPVPLRRTADAILSDFDTLAGQVNGVVADLSHAVLDVGGERAWTEARLADILAGRAPAATFARVAYRGLTALLAELGAAEALVSEVRAAEAFRAVRDAARPAAAGALAAELTRLRVAQVAPPSGAAGATEHAAMAAFALALLLVAEPAVDAADAADLCAAALDVTRALGEEIGAAALDAGALAGLVATYADKL